MRRVQLILVPLDIAAVSSQIAESAWNLAELYGAEVHFLHVSPRGMFSQDVSPDGREEMLKLLQGLTGLPQGEGAAPVPVQYQVRSGSPAREIVRYAEEYAADLIVMGTHGRTRLSHMMLGSVAEAVLHEAPCPVVIVPGNKGRGTSQEDTEAPLADNLARDEPFASGGLENVVEANRVVELLHRATLWRATDVHLDPAAGARVRVRFRVDGRLRTFCHLDQHIAAPLLMQVKLMSGFATTQSFEPQEGRLKLPATMGEMEVRVTLVPAFDGDAVALRLLKHETLPRPLSSLGMSPTTLAAVNRMLHQREGLVLVTGPTGVGKTTTVYAMLQTLDTGDRNIVSVEDPVEYRVPSMVQISVNPRHNVTMTRGLRTVLRMDPDVVFIGEVRDVEALEIAMRASSSGRYVFSTLHTRDVASTLTALRDLHANNYSLAGNLSGIICQRLVRCLCRNCRQPVPLTDDEREVFLAQQIDPPHELYQAQGCAACKNSGYRDRIGVFEAVVAEGEVVAAIQSGAPEDELRRCIRETGIPSLSADVLMKVRDGITSLAEARSMGWA